MKGTVMSKEDKILAIVSISIAVALIVGCVFIIRIGMNRKAEKEANAMKQPLIDTRLDEQPENPLAGRNVSFAGINDCVLETGKAIILENLPQNDDFLLKYKVTNIDTGKVLFETEMIPSGKKIAWIPSDSLEQGVHHISFLQTPFYMDDSGTYIPLTAGNNEVTITIQ